jgi:hypothetical protein
MPSPGHPVTLPTRYHEHRFLVTTTLKEGGKLTFFSDSAGGTFLFAEVAERLKLSPALLPWKENGMEIRTVEVPAFEPRASIPPPLASIQSRLFVFSRKQAGTPDVMKKFDGMLGQQWFGGRIWTFDYPARRLPVAGSRRPPFSHCGARSETRLPHPLAWPAGKQLCQHTGQGRWRDHSFSV